MSGKLWGVNSSSLPISQRPPLGPAMAAPTSAATPPVMWT
eukprot:CAMPEP_0172831480 /NCGR_PEP_ID=MMETSP1075-20121228/23003_1 /TAXON_ID=2916 /ORGANISM="Ceratium fusus, Strain PA161109" /LENGTH=39 /DNA_ID= /DNA_START= /DNA_END= /DNA_ORIENTATION=